MYLILALTISITSTNASAMETGAPLLNIYEDPERGEEGFINPLRVLQQNRNALGSNPSSLSDWDLQTMLLDTRKTMDQVQNEIEHSQQVVDQVQSLISDKVLGPVNKI